MHTLVFKYIATLPTWQFDCRCFCADLSTAERAADGSCACKEGTVVDVVKSKANEIVERVKDTYDIMFGHAPMCSSGRRGAYCSQPDCTPCQNCSGHGNCTKVTGWSLKALANKLLPEQIQFASCSCSTRWEGRSQHVLAFRESNSLLSGSHMSAMCAPGSTSSCCGDSIPALTSTASLRSLLWYFFLVLLHLHTALLLLNCYI